MEELMTPPMVSVLLPVYNAEKYITESIQSILDQTYKNFELIILEDCSTDCSITEILKFNDKRIVVHKNETNKKLISTLNIGLSMAKGKYIARMDADDIAKPNRFQEQVSFLENNPDYIVVGTQVEFFGKEFGKSALPEEDKEIKLELFFSNPFAHPTVMLRRDLLQNKQLKYDKEYPHIEDYKLWIDLSRFGKFKNLPIIGLKYRKEGQNITVQNIDTRQFRYEKIYNFLFDFDNPDEDFITNHYLFQFGLIQNIEQKGIDSYIKQLENHLGKYFSPQESSPRILKLKLKITFFIIDSNKLKGIYFALKNNTLNWKILKYWISSVFKPSKKK